jgi:diadenosine tetraphosphatase ApaH/serine/threonine PP2A family protein phosphatase
MRESPLRVVHALSSVEAISNAEILREPLFTDRRLDSGPFDIIGDVHGCLRELTRLLDRLGYARTETAWRHLNGRRAIFLGDLVDRGPDSPGVLPLVMDMVAAGTALCVQGNHDNKLLRKLSGRDVQVTHGMPETLAQLDSLPEGVRAPFIAEGRRFLDGLRSHYWLDGGKLVVAHAGLKAEMYGRGSAAVRSFALYGETTGETDEFGLPIRYEWARDYRGEATVVYGHTPVPVSEWINRIICIDNGCVFGGNLTALRYPERELVSVPAVRTYAEPVRPLGASQPASDAYDLLDIEDVSGKRVDLLVFQMPVVFEDEVVVAQFALNTGGVDARLAEGVGQHDDERVKVGVFQRGPWHQGQRCHRALGTTAEADDLQPLDVAALECTGHLVEEVG